MSKPPQRTPPAPPTQPPRVAPPPSSRELETIALNYLESCSEKMTWEVLDFATQAVAYALLALLRFLRETEAKEQGCHCNAP